MKALTYISIVLISCLFSNLHAQEISPYILVGESQQTVEAAEAEVGKALQSEGFEVIGNYDVGGNPKHKVIVFTRKDLKDLTLKVKDRGALAAALKVGIKSDGQSVKISYLNPEYLFNAYLMDAYDTHNSGLEKVSQGVKKALSPLGNANTGFGGGISAADLRKYHYKIMMPYFTDPVELNEFESFDSGVKTIEKNLTAGNGGAIQVYSLKFPGHEIAVFGVGLSDSEEGESHFLPIIGDEHLAAMPYELILQGNEATMLNGKYRLALHWPELSMGTFMKISGTPGDIKDVMKGLCK